MKITNTSNYPKTVDGTWIQPGETKEVSTDISEDELSYHFKLEDDDTSETAETDEVEEDVSGDEDDEEESSKSEKNNENVGD